MTGRVADLSTLSKGSSFYEEQQWARRGISDVKKSFRDYGRYYRNTRRSELMKAKKRGSNDFLVLLPTVALEAFLSTGQEAASLCLCWT